MDEKYIIDTNVPLHAAKTLDEMNDTEVRCKECCFEFIENFIGNPNSKIVLDDCYEIYNEYTRNINIRSGPSIAVLFLRWVSNHINRIPAEDLVHLDKTARHTYKTFPSHPSLDKFDKDDRKFIALSIAHPQHPKIVQGTDYKWKLYVDTFLEFGIFVLFLCPEYIDARIKLK